MDWIDAIDRIDAIDWIDAMGLSHWRIKRILVIVDARFALGGKDDSKYIEAGWLVDVMQTEIMIGRADGIHDLALIDGIFGSAPGARGARFDLNEDHFARDRVEGNDVEFVVVALPAGFEYLHTISSQSFDCELFAFLS